MTLAMVTDPISLHCAFYILTPVNNAVVYFVILIRFCGKINVIPYRIKFLTLN